MLLITAPGTAVKRTGAGHEEFYERRFRGPQALDDIPIVSERMAALDADGFAFLYETYGSLVFGIAKRVVKNLAIAEDITQSVFLKLWTSHLTIGSEYFVPWLALVARNSAIDAVRSKSYKETRLDDGLARIIASKTDIAVDVVDGSRNAAVREAVAGLPKRQRQPIELAYFGGLTYAEVADRLLLPVGTVKSRIRAGLHHLGQIMDASRATPGWIR